MTTPIPQPPSIPLLGNIADIDTELPIKSFTLLAHQYGEIYKLSFGSNFTFHIVNTYELANELCDESRFQKRVMGALGQVRELVGDALFTANPEEPNWGIAHRVLMPAFGPNGIRNMLEPMRDIALQLIQKWERFGPDNIIDPAEDYTRLALDTLFFCSMNHRINSFYNPNTPPFVEAMGSFLQEAGTRSRRPALMNAMMRGTTAQWLEHKEFMLKMARDVIAQRRANPSVKYGDLLDTMLYSKDPKTGETLPEDAIARNLVTFMIAGHETTSGTLSFLTYFLLKHPEAMRKVREEVDTVVGSRPARYEDLSKLPYITAVLRETLRLYPPASIRNVVPLEDTTLLNGKYAVPKGKSIGLNAFMIHRDPLIWGDDAEEFKPERMMDGKFEALPKNAWQPFGYGMRACIGRPFAWQEMLLVLTTIFQTFDLSLADPSYNLELKQTLTVKPHNFHIKAKLRATAPDFQTVRTAQPKPQSELQVGGGAEVVKGKQPIYILYGSNTGTCEGFAQTIANDAPSKGFRPVLGTMDSSTGSLPTDGPVIIVTASFEGQPPDNAGSFVNWLESLPSSSSSDLSEVKFAVFGCGNPDWVTTYHRIPILVDDLLAKAGAKRLAERGVGNVVEGGFFEYFENWERGLWTALSQTYSTEAVSSEEAKGLNVQVLPQGKERAERLRQTDVALGKVLENQVLTAPGAPAKHHLEITLPEGMSYRAGDYLTLLPRNPQRDIRRALARFGLGDDDQVIISGNGLATTLPVDKPASVADVLGGYVELAQPATTRDLRSLLESAKTDEARAYIQNLIDNYTEKVQSARLSVLSILESQKDQIDLSFSSFLYMLPSMRVRQYSISSSPLWNPTHVTLTIAVLDSPSRADSGERFLGVASNYIAGLRKGDTVQVSVRLSGAAFHPPTDPKVPMVLFCAGSGIAPFHGFVQERALQKEAGRDVHPVLLFFGCRYPEQDYLYGDSDIKKWVEDGVLDIRPAFSRKSEDSNGCKYVQDRIWHDRNDVSKAFDAGGKFYMCGSAAMAKGVRQRLIDIMADRGVENASEKFEKIVPERFATDIFD